MFSMGYAGYKGTQEIEINMLSFNIKNSYGSCTDDHVKEHKQSRSL